MSVRCRNKVVLDLVKEFADVKGMSRSGSLLYLSERMLNQMAKAQGDLQWHR